MLRFFWNFVFKLWSWLKDTKFAIRIHKTGGWGLAKLWELAIFFAEFNALSQLPHSKFRCWCTVSKRIFNILLDAKVLIHFLQETQFFMQECSQKSLFVFNSLLLFPHTEHKLELSGILIYWTILCALSLFKLFITKKRIVVGVISIYTVYIHIDLQL